jgi:hypothetical protein
MDKKAREAELTRRKRRVITVNEYLGNENLGNEYLGTSI